MLIDWFTVIAQTLNFLILVWLMKRFLYKPILKAIDDREGRVAAELADAAAKKAEAQKDRDNFQQKNEEFDRQREALLAQATKEAATERQRLMEEAQKAADAISAKRLDAMRASATGMSTALIQRTEDEVFAISRKALADLAGTSLQERISEVFIQKLQEMATSPKEALGNALRSQSEPAILRSAFDLAPQQRASLQNALNVTFSADIHLLFETAPDLISGIELTITGQKLSWNIAEYLTSLQASVDEILKKQDKPVPSTESKNLAVPTAKAS